MLIVFKRKKDKKEWACKLIWRIAWDHVLQLEIWSKKKRSEKKKNWLVKPASQGPGGGREGAASFLPSPNFRWPIFFRHVPFRPIIPTTEHGPRLFGERRRLRIGSNCKKEIWVKNEHHLMKHGWKHDNCRIFFLINMCLILCGVYKKVEKSRSLKRFSIIECCSLSHNAMSL